MQTRACACIDTGMNHASSRTFRERERVRVARVCIVYLCLAACLPVCLPTDLVSVQVVGVASASPAAVAGVLTGDLIESINGVSTAGATGYV